MKGGIQRKGVIAKMQRIKLKKHEVSGKKEVSVCDIGFNGLNAESMEERHDKVETKGESCKNIVITPTKTKIEICYK